MLVNKNNQLYFQFKNLLATEVDAGDPRPLLKELGTIGEGSTSVVKLARHLPDGILVAIKKMNISNQQRPELLINEVKWIPDDNLASHVPYTLVYARRFALEILGTCYIRCSAWVSDVHG